MIAEMTAMSLEKSQGILKCDNPKLQRLELKARNLFLG